MKKMLTLSQSLLLPAGDAATRSYGILGMKGSGKSNAAVVLAEEFSSVGIPWVAIDPKGDWYGVRSAANGKDPGLKVVIFGGQHADVPLEPTAAAGCVLADLILDERLTAVLDISDFSNQEAIEFLAGVGGREGFADRFYRRKPSIPGICHVFLEEAHELCPQQPDEGRQKLVNRISKFQTMGRQRGLGCSVLSQRSARVHKDILTQSDVLVVFRTMGPQDVDAVGKWLKYHGQSEEILASLSSLKDGEGWVWSPEWLGKTVRTQFRRRWTFDSGATPTFGEHAVAEPVRAEIDLAKITERMAETIAKAKADDPKELRKKLHEAERAASWYAAYIRGLAEEVDFSEKLDGTDPGEEDLGRFQEFLGELASRPEQAPVEKRIEVPIIEPVELKTFEDGVKRIAEVCESVNTTMQSIHARIYALKSAQPVLPSVPPVGKPTRLKEPWKTGVELGRVQQKRKFVPDKNGMREVDDSKLVAGARRMLAGISRFSKSGLTESQVSVLGNVSMKGGSFRTYMSSIRTAGYIDERGGRIYPTKSGIGAVGEQRPLTREDLLSLWGEKLGGGARRMFDLIIDHSPEWCTQEEVSAGANVSMAGGSFRTYLSQVRGTGLFEEQDGQIRLRLDIDDLIDGE